MARQFALTCSGLPRPSLDGATAVPWSDDALASVQAAGWHASAAVLIVGPRAASPWAAPVSFCALLRAWAQAPSKSKSAS